MSKNACCKWLDFIASVRRLWKPGMGEIDVGHARIAWGRYCATPSEYVRSMEVGNGH